jgi:hypothetical protein
MSVKNNLSARRSNSLAYRIAGVDIGNGISAPYVIWEDEPVSFIADQAWAMAMEPECWLWPRSQILPFTSGSRLWRRMIDHAG